MEHSDEDLILQFKGGHPEVMGILFARHKNRLFNFCLRLLGNWADAEDITGDVFLKLIGGQYTFEPQAQFSTWLFTIARNRCIDQLRQKKGHGYQNTHGATVSFEIPDNQAESSRETLMKRESAIKVRKAILQLPLEQREAIILREYHGFNYDQIAAVLNCSLEKVKILIFRGRQNLRANLKEDGYV